VDAPLLAMLILDAPHDLVELVVKVVQDLDGGKILLVQRLPRVNTNPFRAILYGDPRHVDPVLCRSQSGLFVGIADGAEEAANHFIVGFKFAVVGRLLEHAQVEIRWW
jgi:hypothetical protein